MTDDERIRLRHVPRNHPAMLATGDQHEHAAAPEHDDRTLCGRAGAKYRHLFEDVGRRRSCPVCQARSDAIRASDLLGAVRGASSRGDIDLAEPLVALIETVESALQVDYPADASQPDFDVHHRGSWGH